MTTPAPDIDEGDLLLAECAKLDMALARDLHARALATEDNYEAAALARAYQGLTRSMRQNLTELDARKNGRVRAARDAEAATPRRERWRIAARRDVVRSALRRVTFAAVERARHAETCDWIEDRLRVDDLPDDFAEPPLDAQIVEICEEMGVKREIAVTWRRMPDLEPDLEEPG